MVRVMRGSKSTSRAYFWVASILAVYCWLITVAWLVAPSVPLTSWGMEIEPDSAAFGLRGGVATAAFGVALFLVRREPRSRGRLAVSVAFIGAWLFYAAVGVYMVITDVSGVGMLATVGVEITAAAALAWAEFWASRPAERDDAPLKRSP
jgi:peptidoglycan/LPS O-acetylase OafA/YrhL